MKKVAVLAGLPAVFLLATALPAHADASGDGSGYGTQPGYETAIANSGGCAGHGSFGAFGKDNNFAGGADGQQTGINNSSLCGNRFH
jgi:hypothetical protein